MQQQPKKKSTPWLIFCALAVALLFLAIGVRVSVEESDNTVNYADQTPVSASYSNIRQGAGSSTHAQFSESTKTIKGVNGNPWGYDFDSTGDYIYDEIPGNFCKYFKCISTFWTDSHNGYIVECQDGEYSRSGGYGSACDGHGGTKQALYWHP